jgi:hypothetical protein
MINQGCWIIFGNDGRGSVVTILQCHTGGQRTPAVNWVCGVYKRSAILMHPDQNLHEIGGQLINDNCQ